MPSEACRSHGEAIRYAPGAPSAVAVLTLGGIALAGLAGFLRGLPAGPAFFASALGLTFFPGMAMHYLVGWPRVGWLVPEKAVLWFVGGLAWLSTLAFLGILLGLRLSWLARLVACSYLALIVVVIVAASGRKRAGPTAGWGVSVRQGPWPMVLIGLAVALALSSLYTARDNDDWFYLAYIGDYLRDLPLNSQDAFLGPGWAAPARAWYGSWWVTEALMAKAAGVDPIRCHQIYLPLLLIPMAVMTLFTLARRVFETARAAYLACFVQVVFLLSSAYPTDSAGWGLVARIAQDKTLAFFVPATAAQAFGLGLLVPAVREKMGGRAYIYMLYVTSVVAAALIHPLGLVWCAIGLVPIAAAEAGRRRDRASVRNLVLLLIPIMVLAAILSGSSGEAAGVLEERGSGAGRMGEGDRAFRDFYLPGQRFGFAAGDRLYEIPGAGVIAHPLLVTRYPLALLGLVLTIAVARRARSSFGARYLVVLTASVGILAFLPGAAAVTTRFINERMLYRLVWLFPWGFIIAMFLVDLRIKLRWAWLIAIALALAMARGVPQNYFRVLMGGKLQGRVGPELEEVYTALRMEPTPRGVVLASQTPSLMLPASVDAAYPAYVSPAYTTGGQDERIRSAREVTGILANGRLDEVLPVLDGLGCRYVLLERTRPLANALRRPPPHFRKVFENRTYVLYAIER
jgi:hypothetical protein